MIKKTKKMNKQIKQVLSTVLVVVFLFTAFGSGESKKMEEPSNDTKST
jgi:hypothetical protein